MFDGRDPKEELKHRYCSLIKRRHLKKGKPHLDLKKIDDQGEAAKKVILN